MIAFITDLFLEMMSDYLELIVTSVSGPLRTLLSATAIVVLALLALNHTMQFKRIHYAAYLGWAFRYVLIMTFAFNWQNYNSVVMAIMELPNDFGTLLVRASVSGASEQWKDVLSVNASDFEGEHSVYAAMDKFVQTCFWMMHDFFRDTKWYSLSYSFKNIMLGVLMGAIGGIWGLMALVISVIALVGLMMALSMGPLAICLLMAEQTRQYFAAWCRLVVGFLVIPLLLAAMTSVLLYVATRYLVEENADSPNKWPYLVFGIIVICSFVMIRRIPEWGSTLAGSAVGAAGSGIANAVSRLPSASADSAMKATQNGGKRFADRAKDGAKALYSAAKSGINQMGEGMYIMAGGYEAESAKKVKSMSQSAAERQQRAKANPPATMGQSTMSAASLQPPSQRASKEGASKPPPSRTANSSTAKTDAPSTRGASTTNTQKSLATAKSTNPEETRPAKKRRTR